LPTINCTAISALKKVAEKELQYFSLEAYFLAETFNRQVVDHDYIVKRLDAILLKSGVMNKRSSYLSHAYSFRCLEAFALKR